MPVEAPERVWLAVGNATTFKIQCFPVSLGADLDSVWDVALSTFHRLFVCYSLLRHKAQDIGNTELRGIIWSDNLHGCLGDGIVHYAVGGIKSITTSHRFGGMQVTTELCGTARHHEHTGPIITCTRGRRAFVFVYEFYALHFSALIVHRVHGRSVRDGTISSFLSLQTTMNSRSTRQTMATNMLPLSARSVSDDTHKFRKSGEVDIQGLFDSGTITATTSPVAFLFSLG